MLNSVKESEQIPQKNIITVTPEEFLAMASNCNMKTNILKQLNGGKNVLGRNFKRIVMKKNKIIPVSNLNNVKLF